MVEIIQGDCLKSLRNLAPKSVNTCVTSPPYFGLRDYGTAEWEGGDEGCNHSYQVKTPYNKDFNERWGNSPGQKKQESQRHEVTYKGVCKKCGAIRKDSQIGLEETPEEFVENLVKVFKEVKRVLRDDGTVWLNLGDSFFPNKQLGCIPFKVAIALQDDGWYLRQDIIWHKPNPMPESVRDRCTKSHEYIFLLSKSKKYYYDNEAIKEDAKNTGKEISLGEKSFSKGQAKGKNVQESGNALNDTYTVKPKRNKRSVWTVTTKPFKGAHFAVFPMDLIEPCVLAGCPEKVCVECGTPYKRKMKSVNVEPKIMTNVNSKRKDFDSSMGGGGTSFKSGRSGYFKADGTPVATPKKDLGFKKQCQCVSNESKGGTVLDPFGGSGTTGLVAQNNNRNAILLELNPEYIEIAESRLYPKQRDFLKARVVA